MPIKPQLRVVFAVCAAIAMWLYARPRLQPYITGANYSADVAGGPLGDLYPSWFGTRELIINHRSPYGEEVTQSLQIAYYGHVLESGDRRNQQRFAYPVYIALLFAPTIWLPFHVVQIIGFWLLALITAASLPLWLRVVHWDASWSTTAALQLLVLSSIAVVHGLELQQLSLLVSAMAAGGTLLIVRRRFLASGCMFGLAMIKPQLLLLPILWLMLWSLSNWRKGKRFVMGFCATLAILIAAGELMLPGWIRQFVDTALAYSQYTHPTSLLELLLGFWGFVVGALLLVLLLARICLRHRSALPDSPDFALAMALMLAANLFILPLMSPYNQALLIPGVLVLLHSEERTRVERWLWKLTAAALLWPWITAALLVAISRLNSPLADAWIEVPLYSTLVLPMLIMAMLIARSFRRPLESSPAPANSSG
ncbi:MAG: glycosyltransferase family 87 protein [Terriglobales bacterium]